MRVRRLVLRLVPLFLGTTSVVLADKSAKEHLNEGNAHLSRGNYDDALKSFAAAIDKDPENYLSYFKRAATYLSLRRSTSALEDFSKSLELKPDFDQALLQRAKLYLKISSLTEAKGDLNRYLKKNPEDAECKELLESVEQVDSKYKAADDARKASKYGECVQHLSGIAKHVPQSVRLYLTRAACHLENNEVREGAVDLSLASQLNPSDTSLCLRLATLKYFALYNPDESKQHSKQCLHYDPENKSCKAMHRLIKRIEKQVEKIHNDIDKHRWQSAINKIFGSSKEKGLLAEVEEERRKMNEGLQAAELRGKLHSWACKAYMELKDDQKAVSQCTEALGTEGDDPSPENLINRGEAYMLQGEYEAAARDFSKAHDATDGADRRASQGYQRARRFLERSKKRDYYKVLGVSHAASKQEIKKAYHKLAQQWHPDKYKGKLSADEVANKMSAINQAYEVLSNDELRQRYDQGEDPNDPNGGQGQAFYGQNPFMHFGGFGGFGGSSFSFKFDNDDGRAQYFKWP